MRHTFARQACALGLLAAVALGAPAAAAAADYLVLYKKDAVPVDAKKRLAEADGRLVYAYPEIGLAVARSGDRAFRADLLEEDPRVHGVVRSDAYSFDGFDLGDGFELQPGDLPNAPATDTSEPLFAQQWNMRQIQVPEAHAITGGSPLVTVAHLDSGVDGSHPDLAQNVDRTGSVNCASGAPVVDPTGLAWADTVGHGTFTAGLVAAASNGQGIVGTAPNVKLAAIKIANGRDPILWPAVVCGLVHAGRKHMDVANNSYVVDPNRFFCRDVRSEQVVIQAIQRAVQFARREGVTVVAAAGNENIDLAHPPMGNECVRLPTELPGVVAVSAVGSLEQKAFYSNYGVGEIDLTAPGGDPTQPVPATTTLGMIMSTFPGGTYRINFGTSFAAPHVSGVAALVVSRFGDLGSPQNGKMRPGKVEAILQQTADEIPCPPDPFAPVVSPPFVRAPTAFPAECQGGEGYNSFYGHGQVNALRAVTHDPGNS